MSNSNNINLHNNAATEATAKVAGAVLDVVLEAATADEAHEKIAEIKAAQPMSKEDAILASNRALAEANVDLNGGSIFASAFVGAAVCVVGRTARKLMLESVNETNLEGEDLPVESWGSIAAHAGAVAVTAAAVNVVVQKTVFPKVDAGYHAGISTLVGTTTNLVDALFGDNIADLVMGQVAKLTPADEVEVEEVIA